MAIRIMHDNGISITSRDDASHYHALASYEKHWINEFFANKFSVTTSGLTATLDTGGGNIYGHHIYNESTLTATIPANFTGWLVIRYNTSASIGNEGSFLATSTLTQNDLQNGGLIYDMPLYRVITNATTVTTFQDFRQYKEKFGVAGLGYHQVNVSLTSGSYNSTTRIATWTTSLNVTDRVFVGSKIKFQSNLGTTYAIVHAITSTTLTLFHKSGTASLATPSSTLINVGIGRPADFPEDNDSNWTVAYDLTSTFTQNTPVAGTFYQSTLALAVGIGRYNLKTSAVGGLGGTFANNNVQFYWGTGTASTPSARSKKVEGHSLATTSVSANIYSMYKHEEVVTVTSGTSMYRCLVSSGVAGGASISVLGTIGGCYMMATSIYA